MKLLRILVALAALSFSSTLLWSQSACPGWPGTPCSTPITVEHPQMILSDKIFSARFDASAATSTAPIKADLSANKPTTCTANKDLYLATDTHILYQCNGAGTGWSSVSGGGVGGSVDGLDIAPNSVTTTTLVTDTLMAKYGPWSDVTAWGAHKDCTNPNETTAKIQEALNYYGGSIAGGVYVAPTRDGELFFPVGCYAVNQTLTYVGGTAHSIHIRGVVAARGGAQGTTIVWAGAANQGILDLYGANNSSVQDITFSTYNGGASAAYSIHDNSAQQFFGAGSSGVTFENLHMDIHGAGHGGIKLGYEGGTNLQADTVRLQNVMMLGSGESGTYGVQALTGGNCKNFTIVGGGALHVQTGYNLYGNGAVTFNMVQGDNDDVFVVPGGTNITIIGGGWEGTRKLFDQTWRGGTVTVIGGEFSTGGPIMTYGTISANSLGFYSVGSSRGPVEIIGTNFRALNTSNIAMPIGFDVDNGLVSRNNLYQGNQDELKACGYSVCSTLLDDSSVYSSHDRGGADDTGNVFQVALRPRGTLQGTTWQFAKRDRLLSASSVQAVNDVATAWTQMGGSTWVYDTGIRPNLPRSGAILWIRRNESFPANQYATSDLSISAGQTTFVGPAVRVATDGTISGYYLKPIANDGKIYLVRTNAGVDTALANWPATFSIGGVNLFSLTVVGSSPAVLTVAFQGVTVGTYSDSSASRLTAGAAGMVGMYDGISRNFTAGSAGLDVLAATHSGTGDVFAFDPSTMTLQLLGGGKYMGDGSLLTGLTQGQVSGLTTALGLKFDIASFTAAGVVAKFNSGTCSGYLKSDGTCDTPAGAGTVTDTGGPLVLNNPVTGAGGNDIKTVAALQQSQTHANVDTDTGSSSLHHTLGTGAGQSAAGNHGHDSAYLALHAKADTAGAADSAVTLATGADRTKLDGIAAGATVAPALSSTNPPMDGTAAPGTGTTTARADHVHPTDTSRVPSSRTVAGKALSGDITIACGDLSNGGTTCPTAPDGSTLEISSTTLRVKDAGINTTKLSLAARSKTKVISDFAPASTDVILAIKETVAIHITGIQCQIDTGTSVAGIQLYKRAWASGSSLASTSGQVAILSATYTATTTSDVYTTWVAGTDAVAANTPVVLIVGTVTGATGLWCAVDYTIDTAQ